MSDLKLTSMIVYALDLKEEKITEEMLSRSGWVLCDQDYTEDKNKERLRPDFRDYFYENVRENIYSSTDNSKFKRVEYKNSEDFVFKIKNGKIDNFDPKATPTFPVERLFFQWNSKFKIGFFLIKLKPIDKLNEAQVLQIIDQASSSKIFGKSAPAPVLENLKTMKSFNLFKPLESNFNDEMGLLLIGEKGVYPNLQGHKSFSFNHLASKSISDKLKENQIFDDDDKPCQGEAVNFLNALALGRRVLSQDESKLYLKPSHLNLMYQEHGSVYINGKSNFTVIACNNKKDYCLFDIYAEIILISFIQKSGFIKYQAINRKSEKMFKEFHRFINQHYFTEIAPQDLGDSFYQTYQGLFANDDFYKHLMGEVGISNTAKSNESIITLTVLTITYTIFNGPFKIYDKMPEYIHWIIALSLGPLVIILLRAWFRRDR